MASRNSHEKELLIVNLHLNMKRKRDKYFNMLQYVKEISWISIDLCFVFARNITFIATILKCYHVKECLIEMQIRQRHDNAYSCLILYMSVGYKVLETKVKMMGQRETCGKDVFRRRSVYPFGLYILNERKTKLCIWKMSWNL